MSTSLFSVLFSFMFSFLGSESADFQINFDETPVNYTCESVTWKQAPIFKNGHVVGTIVGNCEFEAINGGGYPVLNDYLQTKIEELAETIHSGPTPVDHKGLDALFYDTTVFFKQEKEGGMQARIREDSFIATDMEGVLHFDMIATKIDASGYAKYAKGGSVGTMVASTDRPGFYTMKLEASFKLEKPWYAPVDMIISEIKKRVNQHAEEAQGKLIFEIAKNI